MEESTKQPIRISLILSIVFTAIYFFFASFLNNIFRRINYIISKGYILNNNPLSLLVNFNISNEDIIYGGIVVFIIALVFCFIVSFIVYKIIK